MPGGVRLCVPGWVAGSRLGLRSLARGAAGPAGGGAVTAPLSPAWLDVQRFPPPSCRPPGWGAPGAAQDPARSPRPSPPARPALN